MTFDPRARESEFNVFLSERERMCGVLYRYGVRG